MYISDHHRPSANVVPVDGLRLAVIICYFNSILVLSVFVKFIPWIILNLCVIYYFDYSTLAAIFCCLSFNVR